jgi:hypothetical protein
MGYSPFLDPFFILFSWELSFLQFRSLVLDVQLFSEISPTIFLASRFYFHHSRNHIYSQFWSDLDIVFSTVVFSCLTFYFCPAAIVMESSSGPTRHVNQKWTSVYRLMVRFAVEIPENEKSIGRLTV